MLTLTEETKRIYLDRLAAHRAADEIIQGQGWDGSKGCAIGCTLNAYDHEAYERELGVPMVLAHLIDAIHEGLPLSAAKDWPARVLAAVPTQVDLSMVWPRFAIWLLTVECASESGTRVAALYQRRIDGDEPTDQQWDAWAAWDARAASAARAAWAAWAASAARAAWAASAARDASAARAAWAASAARDARDARDASYQRQADHLVALLKSAS